MPTSRDVENRQIPAATKRNSGRRRFAPGRFQHRNEPMTEEEWMFAEALQRYKEDSRNFFPTSSEVLKVLKSLGYRRIVPAS